MVHLTPSHLARAEIYEALAEPDSAAKYYRAFIQLWKDSDPPLQVLVEQAKTRMTSLDRAPVRDR